MLILPLARKPDWRRPPVVTLLVVAVNLAVFFLLQHDDHRHSRASEELYLGSPLPEIELPRYADFLEERGRYGRAREVREAVEEGPEARAWALWELQGDGRFLEGLHGGEVVAPEDPVHDEWRRARAAFEERLEAVASQRWGFKPAQPAPEDALAHMFLHGGTGHLVGNMVFLVLVGYVVEAVVGGLLFFGVYLLGGLLATGAFAAVYSHSAVPLVGASGAISGLMGAYVVLFGRRRIPFFYSLGFYFDFARAPAVLLLPVWVALEAYQLLFGGVSQVAYVAHIGGLVGGGLLGAGLHAAGRVDLEFLDRDEQEERDTADLEQGLEHLAKLELDAARARFAALLERRPGHREALSNLYTVARYQPHSDEFHRMAHRIFALPENDPATLRFKRETFRDYVATAKPRTRFDPGQFVELASRFATGGYPEEAVPMVDALLRQGRMHPRLPRTLMVVARALTRQGQRERARGYLQALVERFPDAEEALEAQELLGHPDPAG
ncbi:MAG: rhomboid family intramembrane serine protease [Thiohalorhabdus sp.]|uniref:rhomboid family intramembrane serine protease n=1 Tax=Thiohalorhabdus sp. TaxID=3094134 RepID=UPI00397EAB1F